MELREGTYPNLLVGVILGLAIVDCIIAILAFFQLMRIHSRNSHLGWTRQKVFHFIIGSSNLGYSTYFALNLVAACEGWVWWSHLWGFVAMACPKILFLLAFLLLLSFWVDLCHQSNEEDEDEEDSPREALLDKVNKPLLKGESQRKCCSFRTIHVGSRQKVVILVTLLIFMMMITSAVLLWIGRRINTTESSVVVRVYVDLFAVVVLSLGIALACYGLVLFLKMSKIRSDRASSETWKVAGLAVVSLICFTSSALVAIFTDIPLLYYWHQQTTNDVYTSLLLVMYYFIGSSVPSAFILWVMRELPPPQVIRRQQDSRTLTFVSDSTVAVNPQRWTAATTTQNQ
ncbi:hypothetical protein Leryth_018703 [Lithospermum erythrorhizon]|nr:hypothetical protein Leryth_018703 [Lithospermum erythrorhizon]